MKRCPKCGKTKALEAFGIDRHKKSGHRGECRVCHAAYERTRYTRLIPRQHSRRRADILRRYGLTPEAYQELFELQAGVCSVCGRPETRRRNGRTLALHVDHDHETGAVRGLLCGSCNTLIGLAQENKNVLLSAVAYLESWERAKQWEKEEERVA